MNWQLHSCIGQVGYVLIWKMVPHRFSLWVYGVNAEDLWTNIYSCNFCSHVSFHWFDSHELIWTPYNLILFKPCSLLKNLWPWFFFENSHFHPLNHSTNLGMSLSSAPPPPLLRLIKPRIEWYRQKNCLLWRSLIGMLSFVLIQFRLTVETF